MAITPRIILNNLSFHLENTDVSFNKMNLSFEDLKYGIVGQNGVGKSTFLKLLTGSLMPNSGSIQQSGNIIVMPQSHDLFSKEQTIGDVLGVTQIIEALHRINDGSIDEKDFERARNNWDIEKRIEEALRAFSLWPIALSQPFLSLSGGQKTKILLAKILLSNADFILMDEPTNNLDKSSRESLYQYIDSTKKCMIIVSHDRTLLNKMDQIIEITTKKIHVFGGNYDFYHEQKEIILQALQEEYIETKRSTKKAKLNIQINREKHEQRQSKGKKLRKSSSQSKLILNNMKSRSEKSKSKISIKERRLINQTQSKLLSIKEKIEYKENYHIIFDSTKIARNKIILDIEKLNFKYPKQNNFLIKNFNLKLIGPERIAFAGKNGSGKSTLIKLIEGKLTPLQGTIKIGIDRIIFLDQEMKFLDKELTLIDNFLKLNPSLQIFDAYHALAAFKFKNEDAEKKVASLSGGEKMRAGLAVSFISKKPPQLIILDEPTNHLDLDAIQAIEEVLNVYQGAILAVSHDEVFLKNIGIKRVIDLCEH